jgi:hypothetical protein
MGRTLPNRFFLFLLVQALIIPNLSIFADCQSSRNLPPVVEISNYDFSTFPPKVSGIFHVEGNTTDPDGNDDIAGMSIRITPEPIPNYIKFDGTTKWHFDFDTNEVPDGFYCIWIKGEDKEGNVGQGIFNISISNHPGYKKDIPVASIDNLSGAISGNSQLSGTATVKDGNILKVELRIDDGTWMVPQGISPWTYPLDSTAYSDGSHKISARSYDGTTFSHFANMIFYINNHGFSVPTVQWGGDIGIIRPNDGRPRFVDFNGDGNIDILAGTTIVQSDYGSLQKNSVPRVLYKNIGDGKRPYFKMTTVNLPYKYPAIIEDITDFDGDGNFDLILADLSYYRNLGDKASPDFSATSLPSNTEEGRLITKYGGVIIKSGQGFGEPLMDGFDARDTGFDLGDINGDGTKDIIFGVPQGKVGCSLNLGNSTDMHWVRNDSIMPIVNNVDWYIYPTLADLNSDGRLDLVVVSFTDWEKDHNVTFFKNVGTTSLPRWERNDSWSLGLSTKRFVTVDFADLNKDGKLDLMSEDYFQPPMLFWNNGSKIAPRWQTETSFLEGQTEGNSPLLVDYDKDGDLDLFTFPNYTDEAPGLIYFRNLGGPKTPRFEKNDSVIEAFPNLTRVVNLNLADLDGNGQDEIVIVRSSVPTYEGQVYNLEYYINTGSSINPHWTLKSSVLPPTETTGSRPFFKDLDGDGDLDMAYSCSILCYRLNDGNNQTPAWDDEMQVIVSDWNYNGAAYLADLNNDGRPEVVVNTLSHGVQYYDLIRGVKPSLAVHEEVFHSMIFGSSMEFGDLDGDGLLDIMAMGDKTATRFYENLGSSFTGPIINVKDAFAEVGVSVLFDASGLTNTTYITAYKWDFGDGVQTDFSPSIRIAHAFGSIGKYNVRLSLRNGTGTITTIDDIHMTIVQAPYIPHLDIGWPFRYYSTRYPARFDASSSKDPSGTNLSYVWMFEGMTPKKGPKVDVKFLKAGRYNATVILTNEKGSSQQLNFTVIIVQGPQMIVDPNPIPPCCVVFLAILIVIIGLLYVLLKGRKGARVRPRGGPRGQTIKDETKNPKSPPMK